MNHDLRSVSALVALVLVSGLSSACSESRRALVKTLGDADTYEAPGPDAVGSVPIAEGARGSIAIRLAPVGEGFDQPTDVQFVPREDLRAVVLEKAGRALRLTLADDGGALSIASREELFSVDVDTDSEMGLLGLAFHPRFAENGRFFVNYNPAGKSLTRVAEFQCDAVTLAGAREVRTLLEVAQPYQNHNGGQLAFGPDGMLYIGMGDGGWRNDPHDNGQDASTLLGALLRIDVDRVPEGEAYGIPADNEQRAGWAPEVFAIGLRNPWRYTFDDDGRLVVADVGQDRYEEVSIVRAGDNLGWNVREAGHCFEPRRGCEREGLVDPVWEYDHTLGQSITGGHVYGGELVPGLAGRYVVADFLSGNIWALALPAEATGKADAQLLGRFAVLISAFGKNATGEIFALDYGAGRLLRIEGG